MNLKRNSSNKLLETWLSKDDNFDLCVTGPIVAQKIHKKRLSSVGSMKNLSSSLNLGFNEETKAEQYIAYKNNSLRNRSTSGKKVLEIGVS